MNHFYYIFLLLLLPIFWLIYEKWSRKRKNEAKILIPYKLDNIMKKYTTTIHWITIHYIYYNINITKYDVDGIHYLYIHIHINISETLQFQQRCCGSKSTLFRILVIPFLRYMNTYDDTHRDIYYDDSKQLMTR